MAYRPAALLLDEPFSAMDYFLKERLRLEMAQVLRDYDGISILVTHDRDEAYQLCEYLLLMHGGRIIAEGRTRELFDRPQTVEAARLTGCKNITRIRPLGPHRICALDWGNIELTTEGEVTEDITHAGIRAHDFYAADDPISGGSDGKKSALTPQGSRRNLIPLENPVLTELPFEWYIVLQNGIWWKIPKDMRSRDFTNRIPPALYVDPSAIMLLRTDAECVKRDGSF